MADAKQPSFIARMRAKINRPGSWLSYDLANLVPGRKIDAEVLDELETRLLTADVGVEATEQILDELRKKVARKELDDVDKLIAALTDAITAILLPVQQPLDISTHKPFVLLVVGVNGSGKTTTIGKLARRFADARKQVVLAAGDTFRAAAIEQLGIWADARGRGHHPAAGRRGSRRRGVRRGHRGALARRRRGHHRHRRTAAQPVASHG